MAGLEEASKLFNFNGEREKNAVSVAEQNAEPKSRRQERMNKINKVMEFLKSFESTLYVVLLGLNQAPSLKSTLPMPDRFAH